jgi:hypothetical protein
MHTRDEFAKAALTGLLAGTDRPEQGLLERCHQVRVDAEFIARCAYDMADAMMKETEADPRERVAKRLDMIKDLPRLIIDRLDQDERR